MQICPRNKWRNAGFLSSIVAQHLSTTRLSIELLSCFLSQSRQLLESWWIGRENFCPLDTCLTPPQSIELYEIQIFKSDFWPKLMCSCRVSFLTTLDLYKAYFRGCHTREYKENICKRWLMPYSLWKKLLRLCALGFYNQVLLDLHCW